MERIPFIFSNAIRYRLGRHLAFWSFWWLFQGFLYAFTPGPVNLSYLERLPYSMVESGLFLTNHIFLAYTLMYFVLPAYLLKGRYLATGGWVIILFLATAALASLTGIYIVRPLENNFAPKSKDTVHRMSYQTSFYLGLLAGLRGGITIGGLAAAIKLMKHLYIKEQRNLQLVKENAESQLQLLKAQVHPHFLFNTLNNIYSHTQNSSPIAAQLAIGLSEMLRYMLYEGSHLLVPLSRE